MSLLDAFSQSARQRNRYWLTALSILLIATLTLSLCVGERWIAPISWFSTEAKLFVWHLRLPRSLAVLLVGASLAVAGVVMQALFENPLAEPGLLGVSNGAGVGLMLAIFLGSGSVWSLALAAMAGALVITLILLRFASRYLSNSRLLLIGVALGMICSATMTWAVYLSSSMDLRQLMYWMMGGFSGVDWRYGWLMAGLLPVLLWLCRRGAMLNLLSLGESSAWQLGLSISVWRNVLVIAVGWLVGVSVALAGAIGFIGLVVPHLLRLRGLTDHHALLPAAALAGATILLIADIVARLALNSAELPVGVVTATLGAPVFIMLLLKAQRQAT